MEKNYNHSINHLEDRRFNTQAQFQKFIDILDIGVIRINEKGLIRMMNTSCLTIFDESNYINKHFNTLNAFPEIHTILKDSFKTQKAIEKQASINAKIYSVTIKPMFINNIFKGILVNLHNITNIKSAEEFQKTFTADVSHELRNPLSSIRGYSEIISRESTKDLNEIKKFSSIIEKEAKRLEVLIKDLLLIAKMDRLDYKLKRKPTDIKNLVESVYDLLSAKIESKNLGFSMNIYPIILSIDDEKFRQVIHNLLNNAIHYTDKGKISIEGYIENDYYCIEVKDTGIGIEFKEHDKIFKRFYRVEEARSRDQGGTGLGLSIVKNVTKKHKGYINVQSKRNMGTSIKVCLPIKKGVNDEKN